MSFFPWKFSGESGDEVEDAPAEDDGVVDVVHVAADQHAVTQAAEDGRHPAVYLEALNAGRSLALAVISGYRDTWEMASVATTDSQK